MAVHLKLLQPLKVLIPNWNFFDRIEVLPALRYRTQDPDKNWSSWRALPAPPTRNLFHLFLNPEGNLHLYLQSQVERLLVEASEQETDTEIMALASYDLILKFLRAKIPDGQIFQFKMIDLANEGSDLFLSQEHTRVS